MKMNYEIPIGHALRAEEAVGLDPCDRCVLLRDDLCTLELPCSAEHRSDGKDVIFKLVDFSACDSKGEEGGK